MHVLWELAYCAATGDIDESICMSRPLRVSMPPEWRGRPHDDHVLWSGSISDIPAVAQCRPAGVSVYVLHASGCSGQWGLEKSLTMQRRPILDKFSIIIIHEGCRYKLTPFDSLTFMICLPQVTSSYSENYNRPAICTLWLKFYVNIDIRRPTMDLRNNN